MKKKSLKSLKLNKESVASLSNLNGGRGLEIGSGSQNDSQCGYSCDPALCTSKEPWGC